MSDSIRRVEAVTINLNTGYVKEPEVEGEDGPSLFDYLEAAYGVERAESLTIGIYSKIEQAGHHAFELMEKSPADSDVNKRANEIESLIDAVEIDVIGQHLEQVENRLRKEQA